MTVLGSRPMRRLSDLIARQASQELLGRERELKELARLLDRDLPRVIHVHGIPGIGKSSLLELFAARASDAGARVIALDCRSLEPTGAALQEALADGQAPAATDLNALARCLEGEGGRVVILLDGYEVMRLVDSWLQRTLLPALPANVRLVMASRQRPSPGWVTGPGWIDVVQTLELGPLETADALELLHRSGVGVSRARRIADQLERHPLALRLATAALRERHELALVEEDALQQALERLTEMLLADVTDRSVRDAVAVASVVRRATRPVLAAMCPSADPDQLIDALVRLPFVDVARDGLRVHEAIRPALRVPGAEMAPERYRDASRRAWHQLVASARVAQPNQLWRYTADILYLIEHPVIREAFFPSGASQFTVRPAGPENDGVIRELIRAHEGPRGAELLLEWWRRLPEAFHVAIDRQGRCAGFHLTFDPSDVDRGWIGADPVTAAWREHLREDPMPAGQSALFLRRWLASEEGERPGDVQAACWLDIKRIYMDARPALRRVYLAVEDLAPYAPVAAELGFLPFDGPVSLGERSIHSAVLDFGPRSVDGWLAELAGAGLGIEGERELLDARSRELVLPDGRVELTPLEYGLLSYLMEREGEAVSRDDLLRDVWQSVATSSSNVVDAVVATLRRKLGDEAARVQTIRGVGYRYRA
jgi:hypothetical protein